MTINNYYEKIHQKEIENGALKLIDIDLFFYNITTGEGTTDYNTAKQWARNGDKMEVSKKYIYNNGDWVWAY